MTNTGLTVIVLLPVAIGLVALSAAALCAAAGPGVRNLVWNAALVCCATAPLIALIGPQVPVTVKADLLPAGLMSATYPAPATNGATAAPRRNSPDLRGGISAIRESQAVANPEALLLIVWLAGAIYFAIRFGQQIRSARAVIRRAKAISETRVSAILADAKVALGYTGRVRLLKSRDIDIPVAAGILSPTILLPAAADDWADGDLRIVILHELAHLKRGDIIARALSMGTCTIHWFNPMVWLLSNLAARDAELATDDVVLNVGIRPSRYAETLLGVVAWITRYPVAEPAMSFASRSRLPRRIHSILRETASRREVQATTRWTVCFAACAIAALAACVRLTPTTAAPAVSISPISDSATVPAHADALSLPKVPGVHVKVRGVHAESGGDLGWIADATRQLLVTLDDPSPQVRGEAARALGRLGATRATPRLEKLLMDPDKFVRLEAQQALDVLATPKPGGE